MKNIRFVFNILLFFLMVGILEGAARVQPEIVELLKPKLNSDRIEYFFGSYGVEALDIDSPQFPESRIANLHSIQNEEKIMRTLAIVDFKQPIHPDLEVVHKEITEGKSIGIALSGQGWKINKAPVYFGTISLSPHLLQWMQETKCNQAALHIYKLEVSKNDLPNKIHYCTIIEVHSPEYLTTEWLRSLYPGQYDDFESLTYEINSLLKRLSQLINNFPTPEGLSNAENVVIQSGKGSFNEQAILALKKQDQSKRSLDYIYSDGTPEQAMDMATQNGDLVFVALENKISGIVDQTVEALRHYKVSKVHACISIPIVMNVLRKKDDLKNDLKEAFGNPQALKQIGKWHNLPKNATIQLSPVAGGTAVAAEKVNASDSSGIGVIGPSILAEQYQNLVVVERAVQDRFDNSTFFALLTVTKRDYAISKKEAQDELESLISKINEN